MTATDPTTRGQRYHEMTKDLNRAIQDRDFFRAKSLLYAGAIPDARSFEQACAILPAFVWLLLEFGVPLALPPEKSPDGQRWRAEQVYYRSRLGGDSDYWRTYSEMLTTQSIVGEEWDRARRGIVAAEYLRDHCPDHPFAALPALGDYSEARAARERLIAKVHARRAAKSAGHLVG